MAKYVVNKIYTQPEPVVAVDHRVRTDLEEVCADMFISEPMEEGVYPAGLIVLVVPDCFELTDEPSSMDYVGKILDMWGLDKPDTDWVWYKLYYDTPEDIKIEVHNSNGEVVCGSMPVTMK